MDSEIFDIVKNEEQLQSKLTELHLDLQSYQTNRDYIVVKNQKLSDLEDMLKRSALAGQLELLERAAFHKNDCNLRFCEVEIHAERKDNVVLIQRKMINLVPISKYLITCAAVSRFEISSWHNSLAIMTSTDTFLIGKTVVSTEQLQNKTVANMKLRPFLENELLLGAFNIYGNTLQCLSAENFLLNRKMLTCRPLQTFVCHLSMKSNWMVRD